MTVHRAPQVQPIPPAASRRLARTAPELWAEETRRREMLLRGVVKLTYRRATPNPPTGKLRKIILGRDREAVNERRELSLIAETYVKTFLPQGSYRWHLKEAAPKLLRIMQTADTWVADAGDGVILGTLQMQGPSFVHCLYVKRDFRGCGIGLGLLRAAGSVLPLFAEQATISWKNWCESHRIPWEMHGERFGF